MSHTPQSNLTEITAPKKLINIKELWNYKDLFYFMVLRDVTVMYKQTIFGFAWAIFNPLIQIVIFSVVFGNLANIKTDIPGVPYIVFSSLSVVPWTYFSNSINLAGNSIVATSSVFTKVYFPRLIIPLTPIFSKMVDFFISMAIVVGVMFYFKVIPGHNIFLIFIPMLLIFIASAGIGIWLSALVVQYRDFKFAIGFLLPLLMYVAPVTYPASLILKKFGSTAYYLYASYPMVGALEGFRSCFISSKVFPWDIIGIGYAVALFILFTGLSYFRKMEKFFADLA
jgi:lipopolysaccharide transport system permease protein